MFGIGLPELLLIMGLGLIVLGPDKLPDLAKQLAKGMVELKRTANSLKNSLQEEIEEVDSDIPELDELKEVAGQPWRGLDGKGGLPTDKLPDGFDDFGVINTDSPGDDYDVDSTGEESVATQGSGVEEAVAQVTPAEVPSDTTAEVAPEETPAKPEVPVV